MKLRIQSWDEVGMEWATIELEGVDFSSTDEEINEALGKYIGEEPHEYRIAHSHKSDEYRMIEVRDYNERLGIIMVFSLENEE